MAGDQQEHPDLDALASHLGEHDAAVEAHLEACEHCQRHLAAIEAVLAPVSSALMDLRVPPEPTDLEARLAEAIGAAAARPRQQVTTLPARTRRTVHWLPVAGGLAAAALVVFGALTLFGGNSTPGGHTTGTAAAPNTELSSTGLNYARDGRLLATELPALLAGKAAPTSTPLPAKALAPLTQQDVRGAQPSSGTARSGGAQAAPASPVTADPLQRLRSTAGLASCIASLTEGTDVVLPLALDYASFEHQPALVIVMPSSKAGKVDIYVVGAGCAQQDAALLFFSRLSKPS